MPVSAPVSFDVATETAIDVDVDIVVVIDSADERACEAPGRRELDAHPCGLGSWG